MDTWETPKKGQVICYNYLWSQEQNEGMENGTKDRPSIIVAAITTDDGNTHVTVFPITTKRPDPRDGIEIPPRVRIHLGLDAEASWVIVSEWNRFLWPGPDLRKPPGRDEPLYGFVPNKFFEKIIALFSERRAMGLSPTLVRR